jgi:predicted nuclease with RNAse H fold
VKYPTFFGIDLTSTEAKPSACLGLDSKSQLVYLGFLTENRDIVALLNFYSPQVIAIDAPLSLPLGLCCLEESCSCEPKFPRKNRQCDQELRQQGIPCYPTSKKTFVKDLIYRGIELKTSIGREVKQASQVIEVYPFASKVRLFGKTIPRKTTKQGMSFLRDKLGEILPSLKPYLDMFDHDLCDATVAAYTALLYHQNRVEALGNSEEGLIFIPD